MSNSHLHSAPNNPKYFLFLSNYNGIVKLYIKELWWLYLAVPPMYLCVGKLSSINDYTATEVGFIVSNIYSFPILRLI